MLIYDVGCHESSFRRCYWRRKRRSCVGDMLPYPTPSKNCAWYFTCRIGMATLWSACAAVCRVNVVYGWRPVLCQRWISSKIWLMLNWQHLLDGMIPMHHQDLFAIPTFPAQGLSMMLVSPGKGSCRHYRFPRALARCHWKQWVPGRLIGLGVRSFRVEILQENPIFVMNCEK